MIDFVGMANVSPLGRRVLEERERRGWTQAQLANKIPMTPQTILNIENGKTRSIKKGRLEKLAEVLGIPINEAVALTIAGEDDDILADNAAEKAALVLKDLSDLVVKGFLTTGKVIETVEKAAASASAKAKKKMDGKKKRPD